MFLVPADNAVAVPGDLPVALRRVAVSYRCGASATVRRREQSSQASSRAQQYSTGLGRGQLPACTLENEMAGARPDVLQQLSSGLGHVYR
jgi:hypothetical protein